MKEILSFLLVFSILFTIGNASIISMTTETQISGSSGLNHSINAIFGADNYHHAIWTYNDNAGGDDYLYYSKSQNGVSWSSKSFFTHESSVTCMGIAANSTAVYTVYSSFLGADNELFFNYSSDGGATFSNEVKLASTTGVQDADIALDSSGNIYIVWNSDITGNDDIYFSYSTDGGKNFSTPLTVNASTAGNQVKPQILIDENNYIYVLWINESDNQIYMSKSTDSGVSFGDGKTSGTEVTVTTAGTSGITVQYYHAKYRASNGVAIVFFDSNNDVIYYNLQKSLSDGTCYFNSSEAVKVADVNDNIGLLLQQRIVFNNEGTVFSLYSTDDTANPVLGFAYSTNLTEFNTLSSLTGSFVSASFNFGTSYNDANDIYFDSDGNLYIYYITSSGADYILNCQKIIFAFPDDKVTGSISDNETDIAVNSSFTFTFNTELLSSSVTTDNVKLLDEIGTEISSTVTFSKSSGVSTIQVTPSSNLNPGTNYQMLFRSKKSTNLSGLQDKNGLGFNNGEDLIIHFKTAEVTQNRFTTFKAYPNPVKDSSVQIRFKTGFNIDSSKTRVDIYDTNETRVKTIESWTENATNDYSTTWDTTNKDLYDVTSGVYYYRITVWNLDDTEKIQKTGKILIIR